MQHFPTRMELEYVVQVINCCGCMMVVVSNCCCRAHVGCRTSDFWLKCVVWSVYMVYMRLILWLTLWSMLWLAPAIVVWIMMLFHVDVGEAFVSC
jgi:hypothetical protein